ncbi:lipoprotein NlpI [Aliidiomarina haloalkalitolerans]|uniref:lipoprotein NlpI n=1 Tax=Aliidiomarina haloalkalitolerans TaxID=859059 RepID=UPI000F8952FB|nr:lipoprotein NlpI [Aliidiomarina haloalkalitolerans]MCL4409908.1 lipoprotein NlpI [Gammaproteobacteria bacterium]
MKILRIVGVVLGLILISGCTSSAGLNGEQQPVERVPDSMAGYEPNLYLVEPLPVNRSIEIELLQLNELLSSGNLDDEQRAYLLQRRAVTHDQLGLRTLALVDANQALELKPDLVDAYHVMGIYLTAMGDYQSAFEAFDSTIELAPDHDYVYLNRGLAAYYNGQYFLAHTDFADFYFQNPADPFRVIWYYFAGRELDSGRAETQLREHWPAATENPWGQEIIAYILGEKNEEELIRSAFERSNDQEELNHYLCEAYFYMGKMAATRGQTFAAINYFKLALATNAYSYLEHRYARTEIQKLRQQLED